MSESKPVTVYVVAYCHGSEIGRVIYGLFVGKGSIKDSSYEERRRLVEEVSQHGAEVGRSHAPRKQAMRELQALMDEKIGDGADLYKTVFVDWALEMELEARR